MNIVKLVEEFRNAIELAKNDKCFVDDISFNRFPRGCCGDTCDLLAEYLMGYGIRTYYVCGTFSSNSLESVCSHAWLEMENGVIIDITGDQFRTNSELLNNDISVYVGRKSNFYNLFSVENRDIHLTEGIDNLGSICQPRLRVLYETIISYI